MKQITEACGCCEGIEIVTRQPTANRPGLTALSYRVGTHATFLETMLARLSSSDYPKLAGLTTRETDDPSIALLDAWAIVADVLTFYNERIINEDYLRTATERRSILELARLVGYKLRPGVASSVYLAYTLDDNPKAELLIPKGARSQSIPGPGELPQSFETSEDLKVRAKWNNLKPRLTQPQTSISIRNVPIPGINQSIQGVRIYLKGINTNLKPNDPLLIDFGTTPTPEFRRVKEVVSDGALNRTLVILQENTSRASSPVNPPIDLIGALTLPPSVQLANSLRLDHNLKMQFIGSGIEQDIPRLSLASTATSALSSVSLRKTLAGGEASHAALKAFAPVLRETLAQAVENAQVTEQNPIKIYALRLKASLFGHNAPKRTRVDSGEVFVIGDWPIIEQPLRALPIEHEEENVIYLDARYDSILPNTWIVLETPETRLTDKNRLILQALRPDAGQSRAEYGLTGPTTQIELNAKWIQLTGQTASQPTNDDFTALRATSIYAQSEELELAEEPVEESVCGGTDQLLELDGVYDGLESGRWVIVSGEREIAGTSGVRFSELAMLASVTQNVGVQMEVPTNQNSNGTPVTTQTEFQILDGDQTRTFITLAKPLEYCFKRDTINIYGNVVKATHGETRPEVLGSGDGTKPLQSFTLKQPPLTYVSASNPSGIDSTLKVYVNNVEWHETDALAGLAPTDRNFVTKTDDEGKTTTIFGNGREGARLPTGIENIKALYRNGIGKPGNVNAGQISLLTTRPLGVKAVINPLRASGGADKESRDQARKNAPLALKALDRLVSVQDYEDFAGTYAGVGKARATEISDGRRQLVHVTIAGADDIPIDKNSDLYRNLRQTLLDYGDPYQALQLEIRELMLIIIEARLRILPDYQWEPVVTQVRTALLDFFSFERRELGQDVLLSEMLSVMQGVRGVAYVDVDAFGGIPEKAVKEVEETIGGQKVKVRKRLLLTPQEIAEETNKLVVKSIKTQRPETRIQVNLADFEEKVLRPAQLAFLTPEVPATLILNQII